MIAWALNRIEQVLDYVRAPGVPVLAPYHRQPPPFEHAKKKFICFSLLIVFCFIYGFFFALFPPAFISFFIAPIAVLALVVIWALPDRDTAPTKALEKFFWGFWLTMILWPNYLALALPGLPWITVNRLFGGPLLLLLLVAVSTSKTFRETLRKPLHEVTPLWKMLAAFAVIQFMTIFLSNQPFNSLNRTINLQLVWTSMFFVSAYVFLKPGRIEKWASLLCIMAVITSLIGLVEVNQQRVLWADHIPPFLKVEDPSVQRVLAGAFRGGEYRVVSTFMISLSFAEYLALVSPFLIHIFVITRKPAVRVACLAADVLILTAIIHTQARLGMVGWLLAHSVYGLLWAVRRWRADKTSLVGPALTLAYPAILGMILLIVASVPRIRVLVFGGGMHQASNNARDAQFAMAPPIILQNPLGTGAGTGGWTLGYTNQGGEGTIDTYLLSVVLEYGIVGFILFYGMLTYGFVRSAILSSTVKDRELGYATPVSICLAVFFTIRTVLSQESNNPIMFMLLGMTAAIAYRARQEREAGQSLA